MGSGLPTNEVYELLQDKKGFLWIGSDAGLLRYDGYRFTLFTNSRSRGTATTGLSEDNNGRIWCSNFSGQVFYTEGDSLLLFEPWEKRYKQSYADVTYDGKNSIYISNFKNKIYKYSIDKQEESIVIDDEHTKKKIFTVHDGNVLYTMLDSGLVKMINGRSSQEVRRLNKNGTALAVKVLENLVYYNSYLKKQTLCFQRKNPGNPEPVLYYYSNSALYLHDATTVLQKLNAYPLCCYDDDAGNLLVGTHNGMYWLRKNAAGEWSVHSYLLDGNGISYIIKDREGSFWISTLKNGIFKIANENVWTIPASLFMSKSSGINHLASNNNELLFGTAISGEVFSYNVNNGRVRQIPVKETRDAQALEYNSNNGLLYISKIKTSVYNPVRNQVYEMGAVVTNAKDYYFTADGGIFSTGSSLFLAGETKNTGLLQKMYLLFDTIHIPYNYLPAENKNWKQLILSEQRNKGVWFDESSNTLWCGLVDGLVYYENKKAARLIDPVTAQPIIATGFAQAPNADLYVGTVEQGVYQIRNKKVLNRYSAGNGLLSDKIKRIYLKNNILWIVNGGAVQGMDIESGKIKTIDTHDGLQSAEVYDVETINHMVYVATAAGLQVFPETIETKNRQAPLSALASLVADDKSYPLDGNIRLASDTKNITIALQGIALKSDGAFMYQYRLLPDTSWISVGASENKIRYSSLSPGQYIFQSRVINEDGIMSNETSEVRFTISKAWWQQWWFIASCVLFILLVVYFIFRARLETGRRKANEVIAKAKVQEELRQSQLASLKAQMNPHFMFNALNSIQEFILLNDKKQANMYMGKFADLMRMTLDMSNKSEVALEDEIKSLSVYLELESLRFEKDFTYHINVDNNINPAHIYLPSMLVQPYVENAVKHGLLHQPGEKKVSIAFTLPQKNMLICTITDNGIGRKRSAEINAQRIKKHTSFATGATQKRLELLNHERGQAISVQYSDLADTNGQVSGTSVTLSIPF